jgi:hypothetical protein
MLNIFKQRDNFFLGHSLSDIEEVFDDPHINLAIWQRPVENDILRYIEFLYASGFNSITQNINRKILEEDIEEMFSTQLPVSPFVGSGALKKDIQLLTKYFIRISQKDTMAIHLKTIDHNACRKFHVDGYESRLLCTYEGAGTEWLENRNVKRSALGSENKNIVKNWKAIRQMKPFDVGFLKGENLRSPTGKGIVHRSPPIEATGKKRFLLRIDAL